MKHPLPKQDDKRHKLTPDQLAIGSYFEEAPKVFEINVKMYETCSSAKIEKLIIK